MAAAILKSPPRIFFANIRLAVSSSTTNITSLMFLILAQSPAGSRRLVHFHTDFIVMGAADFVNEIRGVLADFDARPALYPA